MNLEVYRMAEQDFAKIGWNILFNEDPPEIPDPNNPANIPRFTAEKRARQESLERFMTGPGRVLFEQWRVALQAGLLSLLETQDESCHCSACIKLMRLKVIFKLWIEAQRVLEDNKDGKP